MTHIVTHILLQAKHMQLFIPACIYFITFLKCTFELRGFCSFGDVGNSHCLDITTRTPCLDIKSRSKIQEQFHIFSFCTLLLFSSPHHIMCHDLLLFAFDKVCGIATNCRLAVCGAEIALHIPSLVISPYFQLS